MTDESKNVEVQHECFCRKRVKDIVAIAVGSFIGVYCALSLFTALHRPPCPMMMNPYMMHHPMMYHQMQPDFPPIGKFKHGKHKFDFNKVKSEENKEQ